MSGRCRHTGRHPPGRVTIGAALLALCLASVAGAARAGPEPPPSSPPTDAAHWVRLALARDPGLAAQREEVLGAGEEVCAAQAGLWPTVQLHLARGVGERHIRPAAGYGSQEARPSAQASLSIEQLLYDGRRTRHGIQAAQHQVDQQRMRLRRLREQTAATVVQLWNEWRAATDAARAHHRAERELQGLVEQVRQRLAAGLAAEVDLRRAQSRWLESRRTIALADGRREQAALQLQTLTGHAPVEGAAIPALPFIAPAPQQIEDWRSRCRTDCPEVREQALLLARAEADLAAARAERHPRVTLQATHNDLRDPFTQPERQRQLQVQLMARWTLFDGGGRSARESQATHRLRAQAQRLEDTRREVLMRFDLAALRLREAVAARELAERNAELATEAARLARQGFEVGRRPAIELADSLAEAARAADEAAQQGARQWIERAQLLALAGLLIEHLDLPAPPQGTIHGPAMLCGPSARTPDR